MMTVVMTTMVMTTVAMITVVMMTMTSDGDDMMASNDLDEKDYDIIGGIRTVGDPNYRRGLRRTR